MKFGWKAALGIVVSVAALAYTVKGIDMREVWEVLRRSNWLLFCLSGVVATLVFPLRALRWKVILEPVAPVPYGPLWRSVAIGMMVNNVAPARAGELARAYAITKETTRVNFATAFASLAVDRIIDGVVVVVLLVVSVLASDIPATTTINGWTVTKTAWVVGGVAAAALIGVTLVAFFPALVTWTFDAVVGRVSPRVHERSRAILDSLIHGFASLRSPSRFIRIVLWAVALWLTNSLSLYIGFHAVGIDAPFAAAVFVQALIAIGVAAPSTPGFVGVFEFFAVQGLSLYGVPSELAFSWGLGYHVISFIPITVIGLYYFGRLGLHFRDLGKPREQPA
ncbi:MAG: lysylphosphatidylglycerol synthase transmembrane domain-containing protein [Gemmatimonadaceae bacterium]